MQGNHKNMKLLKITSAGVLFIVLFGIIAFCVDYYYYSWTSFVQPFGCRYKKIGPNKAKLYEIYDLNEIYYAIKADSNYEVNLLLEGKYLKLTRVFNEIIYQIEISNYTTSNGTHTEVIFSNNSNRFDLESNLIKLLPKTTANYYISQNINTMIEGFAFSENQKKELKQNVVIICEPTATLGNWR